MYFPHTHIPQGFIWYKNLNFLQYKIAGVEAVDHKIRDLRLHKRMIYKNAHILITENIPSESPGRRRMVVQAFCCSY